MNKILKLYNLKKIRKEKGFTQAEIAEALEIPQQQYSRYENCKNEIPVRYIIELSKIYKVSTDELLSLEEWNRGEVTCS